MVMWPQRDNSGYSVPDDPFGKTAGPQVSDATRTPGGSGPAKSIQYVNSSPWSASNNTVSLNQYHPKHLYGRRGRTQGGQGAGGGGSSFGAHSGTGFNQLSGGNISAGTINHGPAPSTRGLFSGT